MRIPRTLRARARRVRLLVLDVDGVLTDGALHYGPDGEIFKRFDVKDGHGLAMAHLLGLRTAILSGRRSAITERRAKELWISPVVQGARDKRAGLEKLLADLELPAAETAYVGDDINDLAPLSLAGFAACPSDAAPEVKSLAHYVSSRPGGHGAVREIVELLLVAQGRWERCLEMMRAGRIEMPPKG